MYTLTHVHTCSLTETHSHSHALTSLVHPHGLTLTPTNGQEETPTTAAPGAQELQVNTEWRALQNYPVRALGEQRSRS